MANLNDILGSDGPKPSKAEAYEGSEDSDTDDDLAMAKDEACAAVYSALQENDEPRFKSALADLIDLHLSGR